MDLKREKLKVIYFSLHYSVAHLKNAIERSGRDTPPNMKKFFQLATVLMRELGPLVEAGNDMDAGTTCME